jgi:hypothetical protein
MAITQAMTTSFKAQLMLAVHDFRASAGGDTFKLALYTSSTASLDANTTAYSSSNEVSSSGTNYTAGGGALTNLGVVTVEQQRLRPVYGLRGLLVTLPFSNATITARGALIYNTTPSANSNANTTL